MIEWHWGVVEYSMTWNWSRLCNIITIYWYQCSTLPLETNWGQTSQSSSRNFSNFVGLRDFVKMSATMSEVGQYLSVIWPEETVCRIKWKLMSICLVQLWNVKSFESRIAPWLSQKSVVGIEYEKTQENSERSLWIHKMSFEEWVSATYSASVLESVMIGCFLQLQDTIPELMK